MNPSRKQDLPETQRLPTSNNLQVLDNNVVNIATAHNRPGMTCRTCRYYQLPVELEPDVHPSKTEPVVTPNPELDKITMTADGKAVNFMFVRGMCTRHQGYLIVNVFDHYSCPYYNERHPHQQFHDDTLRDGDERDLVVQPRVWT